MILVPGLPVTENIAIINIPWKYIQRRFWKKRFLSKYFQILNGRALKEKTVVNKKPRNFKKYIFSYKNKDLLGKIE